jgi:predicted TIM-barrel fold metal-dependent hydrolase
MAGKALSNLKEKAGIPHFSDGSEKGLLASMRQAGIDISIVSRITTKPEQVESIHKWLRSIREDGIIPMATWHPDLPVLPGSVEDLVKQGFKCVKLHPDYQGFYVDEKRMFPFYEAAQAAGMPILFHAGLDQGLPPPLHAPPEKLIVVHKNFPALKMVAAHMGGEDNYEDTEEILLGRDIYLDTSYVLREMPESTLKGFIRRHSAERIIFGSDSPWKDQGKELDYLLSLPFLNDEEKEKIAGINAQRLLGI